MVDVGVGALGYVGYGIESVEGTAVAPTIFLAVDSVSFPDTNDYLYPIQVKGSRFHNVAMPAPFNIVGTIEMEAVPDGIGALIRSAFAAGGASNINSSPYSGGGYTHVFTPGLLSDTFTFETSAQDYLMMRYSGCRVNTLELKSSFGEIVKASWGIDGIGRAKENTPATPLYAPSAETPFHFNQAVVSIGGSASGLVKDISIQTNNNVAHIGTLRATRAYKRVAMGVFDMMGKMTLDFQDGSEHDRLLNDSEFALSYYVEGPLLSPGTGTAKTSLLIQCPRVKYKTSGIPINAGDFISQDIDITMLQPTGGAIATVTLVTNDASF